MSPGDLATRALGVPGTLCSVASPRREAQGALAGASGDGGGLTGGGAATGMSVLAPSAGGTGGGRPALADCGGSGGSGSIVVGGGSEGGEKCGCGLAESRMGWAAAAS